MGKTRYDTIKKTRDLLLRDARSLEFVRVNITLPKIALQQLDREFDYMPRSRAIAHLILEFLEKQAKNDFLKTEAKKLSKRKDYYAEILETMDTGMYDEDYERDITTKQD